MSVQAMKHNSVPDSLVMRSLREGLCSETSSRSRQQPKENAQRPPCIVRAVFFYRRSLMDGLLICAKAFEDLPPVKYHIIIGRKGKPVDLTVSFEAVEFHLPGIRYKNLWPFRKSLHFRPSAQLCQAVLSTPQKRKTPATCRVSSVLLHLMKLELHSHLLCELSLFLVPVTYPRNYVFYWLYSDF